MTDALTSSRRASAPGSSIDSTGRSQVVGTPGTNTGGFDSAIYFVQYSGATLPGDWQQPLVVRVEPRHDAIGAARVEAACHEWLADSGYPVPRILEVLDPDVVASPADPGDGPCARAHAVRRREA